MESVYGIECSEATRNVLAKQESNELLCVARTERVASASTGTGGGPRLEELAWWPELGFARACRSPLVARLVDAFVLLDEGAGTEPHSHAPLVQTRALLFEALDGQTLVDVLARRLKYSELLVSRIVLQMLEGALSAIPQ